MAPPHPWLAFVAASLAASRGVLDVMSSMIETQLRQEAVSADHSRNWATPHTLARELTTMRVLDFSISRPGAGAIVVAPFALHAATTADFAPGHSTVEALTGAGVSRLVLTDWKSAGPTDRFLSIDSYLADLNILVDDFGAPAALIGLCQGGWLAAAYAARFPAKIARLVLVGAPIDIAAGRSTIADLAALTAPETIDELVELGGGLLLGKLMTSVWPAAYPAPADIAEVLQLDLPQLSRSSAALEQRFLAWNGDVVDLPGVFYRETAEWIFQENRLAKGTFVALGERINLKSVTCPLFLLGSESDEITDPRQLLAMRDLAASAPASVTAKIVPGRHLSLFMGRQVIRRTWPQIARFVASDRSKKPAAA